MTNFITMVLVSIRFLQVSPLGIRIAPKLGYILYKISMIFLYTIFKFLYEKYRMVFALK